MKKLLTSITPFTISRTALNESLKIHDGRFIVTGVLQRADAKNQNGRVYPREILEREVKNYIGREIAENRALGELDHPDSSVVNLRNVSHNILEIFWDGDDVKGNIEILDTPSGNILKSLIKAGVTVGISSRGLGSYIEESDRDIVQDDFELITWDFVSNPSTHGAFMHEMNEGVSGITKEDRRKNKLNEMANSLIHDILCDLAGACGCPLKGVIK